MRLAAEVVVRRNYSVSIPLISDGSQEPAGLATNSWIQ